VAHRMPPIGVRAIPPRGTGAPGSPFPRGESRCEPSGAAPRPSDPIREGRRSPRYDGLGAGPGLNPAALDLVRRVDGSACVW
jgi:hypothetical protein